MVRWFSVMLAVLSLAAAPRTVGGQINWPIPVVVATDQAPVRFSPDATSRILGVLAAGATVDVVGPIHVNGSRHYVPVHQRSQRLVGWTPIDAIAPSSIPAGIPIAAAYPDAKPPDNPAPPAPEPSLIPQESPAPERAPSPQEPRTLTPEEQAYVASITPILTVMSDSTGRFGELFNTPSVGDPAWTVQVAGEFVLWEQAYADAQAISPPKSLRSVHKPLLDAFRIYAEEGRAIARAVDDFDVAALEVSAERLADANAKLDVANRRLAAFTSDE